MTRGRQYSPAWRRVAAERGHDPRDHDLEVMPRAGMLATPVVIWCHTCNASAGPPPEVESPWRRLVRAVAGR